MRSLQLLITSIFWDGQKKAISSQNLNYWDIICVIILLIWIRILKHSVPIFGICVNIHPNHYPSGKNGFR
ncbi:hypothetical protein BOQ60_19070 [Chryseobacterium sp. CH1]|nr:hypothetical protein BOQ60_19070 [Chryseobacterium sp. CH1]